MTWSGTAGNGIFVGVGVMAPASFSGCSKATGLGIPPNDCVLLLGVNVAVEAEADMGIDAYGGGRGRLAVDPWFVPALGSTLCVGVAPSNGGEGGERILLIDCNSCCVSFLL